MKLRLLLMAERAEYRLLVRKHIEIDCPEAVIVEHCLGQDAPLDADFSAAGFDAVVLVGAPQSSSAETFAAEMLFNGAAEQNFPRKMPADAWRDFKGCDRFLVEEQSFLLPNDEVMTVLKLPDEAVA